jgi:hypothetical protein
MVIGVAPFAALIVLGILAAAVMVSPLAFIAWVIIDRRKFKRRSKILDLMSGNPAV